MIKSIAKELVENPDENVNPNRNRQISSKLLNYDFNNFKTIDKNNSLTIDQVMLFRVPPEEMKTINKQNLSPF